MITILCSVLANGFNDGAAPGLIHYTLSSNLNNEPVAYARYLIEKECLEVIVKDQDPYEINASEKEKLNKKYSIRYHIINRLLMNMDTGDILHAVRLADLGETSDEAAKLYFAFLEKGIQMAFYDAGYIDTELHCLNTRPSADQKLMITKNIQNYYRTHNNHPVLSDSERAEYSMMDWAKKK